MSGDHDPWMTAEEAARSAHAEAALASTPPDVPLPTAPDAPPATVPRLDTPRDRLARFAEGAHHTDVWPCPVRGASPEAERADVAAVLGGHDEYARQADRMRDTISRVAHALDTSEYDGDRKLRLWAIREALFGSAPADAGEVGAG